MASKAKKESITVAADGLSAVLPGNIPRQHGKTYVLNRPGDSWHACHVTWLKHTKVFSVCGKKYVDCYLPKKWRSLATYRQNETRPVRLSDLW